MGGEELEWMMGENHRHKLGDGACGLYKSACYAKSWTHNAMTTSVAYNVR